MLKTASSTNEIQQNKNLFQLKSQKGASVTFHFLMDLLDCCSALSKTWNKNIQEMALILLIQLHSAKVSLNQINL